MSTDRQASASCRPRALTVVAGRRPPGSAWRADPAWRELLRVVSLRNLSPEENRQYLHACGVDPARHGQLVEVAHGHPLGLFPDIYETIRDANPLGNPVSFRFPASVRHRYERLDRFPDGLLVLGDAVSSFNPVHGQGMSVAALEALILRRHLERGAMPQPRRFFGDLAGVVDVPWDIAAGGDLVFPGVQGRRTLKARLVNTYIARLHAAAAHDASLASAFVRVAGLVAPPQTLLRPDVAVRVLRGSLRPAAATRGRRRHPDASQTAQTLVDSGDTSAITVDPS